MTATPELVAVAWAQSLFGSLPLSICFDVAARIQSAGRMRLPSQTPSCRYNCPNLVLSPIFTFIPKPPTWMLRGQVMVVTSVIPSGANSLGSR